MKNKLKINAAITTIAVLVCVVLLNLVIGVINEKKPMKIDLTREKVYQFSEQTKEITKNLDKDVNVYALYPEDTSGEYVDYVKEYLSKYEALSDKFIVTYVDPYSDPTFVNKFSQNGENVSVGSIIVTCGDNYRVVAFNELYNQNQYTNSVSIDMEKKMTAALMNVTGSGKKVKVYFTEGHGEFECSYLMSHLNGEGYECEGVNVAVSGIPEDASVLVIADPSNDFTPEEINEIDAYSDKGGHIMLLPQSGKEIPQNLASYISDWGITVNNDYVIEEDTSHAFRSQYGAAYPAPIMQEHDITKSLIEQKINFMAPIARSITAKKENVFNAQHEVLLKTTEKSWGETNLSEAAASKDENDIKGPLNIAVLSSRYNRDNVPSRLFVLGSIMAVEMDGLLSQSSYANGDFMLNTVATVTEMSNALDIRAKKVSDEALVMSQAQMVIVTILLLVLLPLAIFITGVFVWWRRRYL